MQAVAVATKQMSEPEPRVAAILQPLQVCEQLTRELVQSVIDELHALLVEEGSTEVEKFEAHVAIAQVIRDVTHWSNFEQVEEVLAHFRAACAMFEQYATKDSSGAVRSKVASMFGEQLARAASHFAFDRQPLLLSEGESHLRYACLLYTSPSPRDQRGSRMPSSA